MAVKLRLARRGAKKRPFYHIVAADIRRPRDGNYLEKLGTYNPMQKDESGNKKVTIEKDRVEYWLKTGAQPTERVQKILAQLGVMDAPKINERPKKSKPGQKALDRLEEKKQKEQERKEAEEAAKAEAKEAAAAPAEEATEAVPAEEAKAEESAEKSDTEGETEEEKKAE